VSEGAPTRPTCLAAITLCETPQPHVAVAPPAHPGASTLSGKTKSAANGLKTAGVSSAYKGWVAGFRRTKAGADFRRDGAFCRLAIPNRVQLEQRYMARSRLYCESHARKSQRSYTRPASQNQQRRSMAGSSLIKILGSVRCVTGDAYSLFLGFPKSTIEIGFWRGCLTCAFSYARMSHL
jgi:hypothetical protein